MNPERFTGYSGKNIWPIIYQENCFQGNHSEMCHEELMFNRIISGFHTSISSHISDGFYYADIDDYGPNVDFYFAKVGYFLDRL